MASNPAIPSVNTPVIAPTTRTTLTAPPARQIPIAEVRQPSNRPDYRYHPDDRYNTNYQNHSDYRNRPDYRYHPDDRYNTNYRNHSDYRYYNDDRNHPNYRNHSNYRPTTSKPIVRKPSFFAHFPWATIGWGLVILILVLVGAYAYFMYKPKNKNVKFNANDEHGVAEKNSVSGGSNKTAQLQLYSVSWCPHSIEAKPIWNDVKLKFNNKTINGYTIKFEEYDCSANDQNMSDFLDKNNISSFPTIRMFKDGNSIEYSTKPDESTLIEFIKTTV